MRIRSKAGFRYVLIWGAPRCIQGYLQGYFRGYSRGEGLQSLVRSLQTRRYRLKTLAKR